MADAIRVSTGAEIAHPCWRFRWHNRVMPRFLTLADVSDVLSISSAQTYALVRSGELRAIKVGGRGQWRVEETELEAYIARMYAITEDFVRSHPFGRDDEGLEQPLIADAFR